MAVIKINADRFVKGKVSISRKKDELIDGKNAITIYGILVTHDYIEQIDIVETERYYLDGVDVYQEDFGSNDYNIVYYFKADNLAIKEDYIPDEVKYVIEDELYKDENEEFFHADNWEYGLERYNELFNFDINKGDDI